MNKVLNTASVLLFLLAVHVIILWAQVPPEFRQLDGEIQMRTFDKLATQRYITVTSAAAVTAFDSTSTFTADLSYLPTNVEYPVLLVVKSDHTTNSVVYIPYTTNTTGAAIPTATAPRLLDARGNEIKAGKSWRKVIYQDPGISFGAFDGSARVDSELIFETWQRSTPSY